MRPWREGPGDRRSYHHGNLKEALIEAARRFIAERGIGGFTLVDAARLVGVTPAALYRHFRGREALLEEVAGRGFSDLAERLAPTGAHIVAETRVRHEAGAVAAAVTNAVAQGAELVVVFGASAIADRRDVIPAGLEAAGGRVEQFGMPVDPGNLLLLGALGSVPVIGAPGCARSPKENGFDFVLHRLLAGLSMTRADIVRLGVGGLLTEIPLRGQPRSGGDGG
ncbi:TetR family transcriptional regulator [Methylorubrum podarium]|uniref:TetR family transcriptional regulator n=1 Tax=Methylorubrum podarium TaxID=200476 RepID=UPI002080CF5D|nr:hypothetical protein CHKEEEPN_4098 [Methylorubrum podarium]